MSKPAATATATMPAESDAAAVLVEYNPADFRLLVVDDDLVSLKAMSHMLKQYNVTAVDGAEKALELLRSRQPGEQYDLLVTDIQMPGISGFMFLQTVNEDPELRKIPVILMSAVNRDSSSAEKAIRQGSCDYLYKPIGREFLRKRIEGILSIVWRRQNEETFRALLEQERLGAQKLVGEMKEKDKEIDGLRSQVVGFQATREKAMRQIETPIRSIERELSTILSANSSALGSNPQLKESLQNILESLSSTDLYEPAFERMIGEQNDNHNIDDVTSSWLRAEFSLTSQPVTPAEASRSSVLSTSQAQTMDVDTGQAPAPCRDEELQSWEFDIFRFDDQQLVPLVVAMFDHYDILEKFSVPRDTLYKFLGELRRHYIENPYHSFRHAVDVAQTVFSLLTHFKADAMLTPINIFELLLSAIAHDVGHDGFNNSYHIKAKTELALRYNDKSVLENHHCCTLFTILQRPEFDITCGLSADQFGKLRGSVLRCILATDMTAHFEILTKFQQIIESKRDVSKPEDIAIVMQVILKCCDISNVAKPFPVAKRWSEQLTEEYFHQGAHERSIGMTPAPFMDSTQTNMARNTSNFIDYLAGPLFESFAGFFPEAQSLAALVKTNRQLWDVEEKKLMEEAERTPAEATSAG
eukprot:TRINITY_DN3720_c0_g1_i1.p1 TRINITY_DN3720_c0_g1~~TRINITY_DN3720_c0_g1_i1.p1  ORF type:complete len:641 (-),score=163.35 TRINITY_DN3720_c0_g1_i1:105-2027(-)